ncbi:MAG: hypothetical protein KAI67_00960 [Candidatus Pacebacteria bacterium]|nr:hypothetical protein [Candidatus Paceibacterota bacterium]
MTETSFDKIKKLMKIVGGKAIIIENDKPAFVIINVDEYSDFKDVEKHALEDLRNSREKINKDIDIWKMKQDERKLKQLEVKSGSDKEKNVNEITIETL